MQGRRLPDTPWGQLPDDLQPGDYWKCVGNLTRTVWQFYSLQHTVRENEDGTMTVAPGDGSSNSILHSGGAAGKSWHGYVDHGVWQEC